MFRTRTGRLAATLVVIDVVSFVLSGIPKYKNASHGADHLVGEVIWLGFLAGALALLITVAVAITNTARRRRTTN